MKRRSVLQWAAGATAASTLPSVLHAAEPLREIRLDYAYYSPSSLVIRRFGLRGHESSTLEDVGLEIGLTRERVRQIQVEGLKRLREILEKNGLSSESLFQ